MDRAVAESDEPGEMTSGATGWPPPELGTASEFELAPATVDHDDAAPQGERDDSWVKRLLLGVALVVFAIAVLNQHAGHDWGDDFSLYLNQTRSLTRGGAAELIANNRFTVENSSWHSFSPYSYPWGFPLLLSPFMKVFGVDYAVFKVVIASCLAGAMWFYGRLLARRVNLLSTVVLVAIIGLSSEYIGWADTVLSEFPYLMATLGSLWWMDRCRDSGALMAGAWWRRVVLGLAVGYAYTVRKEGLALVIALAAVQAAGGFDRWRVNPSRSSSWSRGVLDRRSMVRVAVPFMVAAGWVLLLQVALPNGGYQSFPGTGIRQIGPNLKWYRDILAQQIGLKPWGVDHLELWGSETLALVLFTVLVTLAVIGVVVRAVTAWRVDAGLLAYFLAVVGIFGITPFHEGRYLFSITPLLLYFAFQAAVFIADALPRPSAVVIATLLVLPLAIANGNAIRTRTTSALRYDQPIWGVAYPTVQEMFDAVEQFSGEDDVVAFFRARLMTFETDRRALQLTTLPEITTKADWYAMAKDSTYSQYLLTDEEATSVGLVRRWENQHFVLWEVPHA